MFINALIETFIKVLWALAQYAETEEEAISIVEENLVGFNQALIVGLEMFRS